MGRRERRSVEALERRREVLFWADGRTKSTCRWLLMTATSWGRSAGLLALEYLHLVFCKQNVCTEGLDEVEWCPYAHLPDDTPIGWVSTGPDNRPLLFK